MTILGPKQRSAGSRQISGYWRAVHENLRHLPDHVLECRRCADDNKIPEVSDYTVPDSALVTLYEDLAWQVSGPLLRQSKPAQPGATWQRVTARWRGKEGGKK